jgi:hypothetical protein
VTTSIVFNDNKDSDVFNDGQVMLIPLSRDLIMFIGYLLAITVVSTNLIHTRTKQMVNLTIGSQTSQKIRSIINGDSQVLPFVCFGGKKLTQPLRYTLEVTNLKPFTVTVYFHDIKTVKNDNGTSTNEVTKKDIVCIRADVGKLHVSKYDEPLSKNSVFKAIIGSQEIDYVFHSDIIIDLGLPYWIQNASENVSMNRISPMWLVVSQLFLNAQVQESVDAESINDIKQFSERDWYHAIQKSSKILYDDKRLSGIPIPEQYKIGYIEPVDITAEIAATETDQKEVIDAVIADAAEINI